MAVERRPQPGERRIGGVLRVERSGRKTTVSGRLVGFLFREGSIWVAYCATLDLASGGPTQAAALDASQLAIRLWLESCIKRGTLERALTELGWVCQTPDGAIADCGTQRIPPAFVVDAVRRRGRDWSQPIRFET